MMLPLGGRGSCPHGRTAAARSDTPPSLRRLTHRPRPSISPRFVRARPAPGGPCEALPQPWRERMHRPSFHETPQPATRAAQDPGAPKRRIARNSVL